MHEIIKIFSLNSKIIFWYWKINDRKQSLHSKVLAQSSVHSSDSFNDFQIIYA